MASDPQANYDFYAGLLGLRLVKRTINYDDPGTYHLYYGDRLGRPGTILTFFPWPGAARGRVGAGQQTATALSVPPGALPFWQARLTAGSVPVETGETRFGSPVLAFADPDGLPLELVTEAGDDPRPGWPDGPMPAEYAIRGVGSVTLTSARGDVSGAFLSDLLGFAQVAEDGARVRYALGGGLPGQRVDVVHASDAPVGIPGAGTVHHMAYATPDDDHQELWLAAVRGADVAVSPVRDRQYFHSIYFHEPGRVLFEIATEPPGFATDEDAAHLGERLCLPVWLEARRAQIEAHLPPLQTRSPL